MQASSSSRTLRRALRPLAFAAFLLGAVAATAPRLAAQVAAGGGSNPPPLQFIAAGSQHSMAIVEGQLLAWGANTHGQLGLPISQHPLVPTPVAFPPGNYVVAVSAGIEHTLVIDDQGRVWATGGNAYGQLGDGGFEDSTTFHPVLRDDGDFLQQVVEVRAGGWHSLALDAWGVVWAWGNDNYGQLGSTAGAPHVRASQVPFPSDVEVQHLDAGFYHSIATTVRPGPPFPVHELYAWGRNLEGELGQGDYVSRSIPTLVPETFLFDYPEHGISAGSYFTYETEESERGAGCGWNWFGQLGPNAIHETEPWLVMNGGVGESLVHPSAGGAHILCTDGFPGSSYLYSWGLNSSGQLGDGTNVTRSDLDGVRTESGYLYGVYAASAGEYHSLAILDDNSIWAWGKNSEGQLGDGTTTDRNLATQVWPQ